MTSKGGVSAYETKNGTRYRARFYVRTTQGNPASPLKQVDRGGFHTRKEAESFRRRQLVELEDNKPLRPSKRDIIPFSDVLDEWINQRTVAPTTLAGDKRRIRLYIRPHLGQYDIRQINADTISGFYVALRPTLSASSILKVREILVSVFKYANEEEYTAANPALLKKSHPPTRRQIAEQKREILVWTSQQANTFVSWCPHVNPRAHKHRRLRVAWLLALFGGLRREEICGLRPQDADELRCRIVVKRAITSYHDEDTKKKKLSDSVTKSTHSRNVTLPRFVMNELLALPASETGRIFDISPDQLTAAWVRVCGHFTHDNPGVPVITLHGLRHTHASMLLEANVAPKVVQTRLGHSSIQITMDTYTHVMPDLEDQAVADLENLFRTPAPESDLDEIVARKVSEILSEVIEAQERA